ncbi:hypothetical protein [Planctomycetes bacterium TBK1r]|uniref:Uncharacterized protein n=1 Tax=Stieleria magnilauensis TaxID=2527963 RepID=A0ABX5Y5H8_9BACT|nr:hypothetical protein TBK1r_63990 [Planctomycetes bacterium TBK1r]
MATNLPLAIATNRLETASVGQTERTNRFRFAAAVADTAARYGNEADMTPTDALADFLGRAEAIRTAAR